MIVAFELMGQQYSLVVKVFQDHALVLKDLAVLNQDGLASESLGTLFRDLTFLSLKLSLIVVHLICVGYKSFLA